jgi:hypothetical protein
MLKKNFARHLQRKPSDVSLFESEIEIEMKRHKIISIIEIEIQLK